MWEKVLSVVLKTPGIKVDREEFLRSAMARRCQPAAIERAMATSPVEVLDLRSVDKLAKDCIQSHTMKAAAVSTATGIPGGLALAATIPGDVLQYFYHSFKVAQKLAYLYGFPDLCDPQGQLSHEAANALTVFTGVMMGTSMATVAFKELCERATVQAFKRLPQMAITQNLLIPLFRNLGMQLAQERATRVVTRAVPIVGGMVSGVMTYHAFRPAARRLQQQLRNQMPPLLTARRNLPTTPPPFKQ